MDAPASCEVHLDLMNPDLEWSQLWREAVFLDLVFLPGQIPDPFWASSYDVLNYQQPVGRKTLLQLGEVNPLL